MPLYRVRNPSCVTVTCDGNTLSEGSDYTLSYKNNINPGTGTIIVTGKVIYKGTLKTTFLITSADGTPVPETHLQIPGRKKVRL